MDDKKVIRVNRISWLAGLFLVLALNPLHGVAEERVFDISNPDPYLWQKIEAELSEREQSRERIGYYALGKEILEFRVVLDVPNKEKAADSEWMVTSDDERFLVSKNAAIGSDDIYGILIEKTTYRGITQYDITLYFKQESFDKIRDISSRFMKKRLAIVREHSLVGAPIVQEAFTQSVNIFSSMEIDTFKKGFLVLEQSALQEYNQRTIDWIEERLKKEPDNTTLLLWLAREYLHEPKGCEKALDVIEKTIPMQPSLAPAVQQCYKLLGLYDRAIAFYNKFLLTLQDKQTEIEIRNLLMEIYGLKGELRKMVGEMEKNLQIMKTLQIPSFDALPEGPGKERFLIEMQKMRDQAIKNFEALIERAKSELNEKSLEDKSQ